MGRDEELFKEETNSAASKFLCVFPGCGHKVVKSGELCSSVHIFLGGIIVNNPWRKPFVAELARRDCAFAAFDPEVEHWDEWAQRREELAKAQANYLIYYLADSKLPGNPPPAYSMVEATIGLYDMPERVIVIFDNTGLTGHPLKKFNGVAELLKARFPNGNIFTSPPAALEWLAGQLPKMR